MRRGVVPLGNLFCGSSAHGSKSPDSSVSVSVNFVNIKLFVVVCGLLDFLSQGLTV